MVEKILDEASYSLVRTNPKLTANVKLVVDSSDNIYLESFNANTILSASTFKAFKVSPQSSYEKDVYRFFQNGTLPKDIAYEAFQQYEDTAVLSNYADQYEMFYDSGAASIASESYIEDLGFLAPLWLNEEIPNYFVIFRLDEPVAVNNATQTDPLNGINDAQTAEDFTKNVLENCTAIKTFDLTEKSNIGSYIRNYRANIDFPAAPLTATWRKDEPFQWSGISYEKGGFVTKGEYSYEGLVTQDGTIIQDEYYLTQGFQRTGIMVANLLNMQFLFTDDNAPDYSYNRYFGLYVNSVNEGDFDLSGEGFYKGTEKTQTPPITTITEVSDQLNVPLELENPLGILLYLDPSTVSTVTGLPTPKRVDEVESIFYVKDKEDTFHTVKKGSVWGNNQIRLFDKKIDISLLTGFKQPSTFATSSIIKEMGQAMASFQFLKNPVDGYRIRFYDGPNFIDEIAASSVMTNGPGTSYEQFFNPNGTLEEVAKSLALAINSGIPEGERYFDPSYNGEVTYVRSRYGGSRFNQLRFELDIAYPDQVEIQTFPATNQFANFTGGSDVKNGQLRVDFGAEERFTPDRFVKTDGGYADILSYTPYFEEPIWDPTGTIIIGYNDIDKYNVIQLTDNDIYLSSNNQAALYVDYKPSFGRFSFFPVRDLNFNFYSDLYSQEGELVYEEEEYNTYIDETGGLTYIGVGSDPDIIDFYEDGGFFNLLGLLREADPDIEVDSLVASEYERLEENYLKTQAVASRITPYINKWCYFQDGRDVRNHPYRLNVSESFGASNFASSKFDFGQYPIGYSHEWYYLCEIPEYFTKEAVESSWSYFNTAPVDEVEADETVGTPYIPGTFQKVTSDGFEEYFLVDKFDFKNEIILIDKQMRWGTFVGGNEDNFAEAFLRGVKITAKPKANPAVTPNFNARSLEYVRDGSFNDYKFSAILVPNAPDKPNVEIKFIKNDKWKTVTMIIFINIDWEFVDGNRQSIDRTLLYSLRSRFQSLGTEVIPNAYENNPMQGALSLSTSINHGTYLEIKGMENQFGIPTQFLTDIQLGAAGTFNNIEWEILSGPDAGTYQITGIFNVISDDILYATQITKNSVPIFPAIFNPTPSELKDATYTILGGGFNAFTNRMLGVSFAEIQDKVSNGDPDVIYETINEDGSRALNEDGSLAETFIIELRPQDTFLKSIYVGVLPDPNKPTIFNLTDIIGYDLSVQKAPRITPISRHSGNHNPITRDLLFFRDPYANINFNQGGVTGNPTGSTGSTGGGGVIPDEQYKLRVLDLTRYANTQFYSDSLNFGQIFDFFYHKVNTEDPSTILELSNESAFKSLYPLINEVGIDYRNFYIFSSNWDPGYFRKSIDKAVVQEIIGTRSMQEKKSFFGSKYLKVPQYVTLETFVPGTLIAQDVNLSSSTIQQPLFTHGDFIHKEDDTKIELYVFIQKRLLEYFFEPVKDVFLRYVNPAFGVGNLTNVNDDVRAYITLNIIPLYKLQTVELFTRALRSEAPTDYETAKLDDADKFAAGLRITDNFSSKLLNTNPFDTRLIYNKRLGYSEQIGLSVTLEKK